MQVNEDVSISSWLSSPNFNILELHSDDCHGLQLLTDNMHSLPEQR